uniref:Uncharacterized protein n=1 Tax=Amphora coffeiformis TaxID=265554 RepID=A0A7S3L5X5_9STRA|mmetsp:Transcript_8660/g.16649  ORF Transcript_8660/g.16649 Transcript_8660/m.16649 type:complete len:243 (+) Transcript_8660:82-810(+)
MPSTTVRVDMISGKLDRTMPVSLQPYMNPSEWARLAQDMDRATALALRVQTLIPLAMLTWFVISAIVMFSSFYNADMDSSGPPIGPFVVVPILFAVLVGGIVLVSRITADKVQTATNNICQRYTQRHAGILSFHIKEDVYMVPSSYHHDHHGHRTASRYSLEIVIANDDGTNAAANHYSPPTVYATVMEDSPYNDVENAVVQPSAPPKKELAADRLAELERIKHLLTPKEYQEKRQSILDSI